MGLTQHPLAGREGAPIKLLGLGITTLGVI